MKIRTNNIMSPHSTVLGVLIVFMGILSACGGGSESSPTRAATPQSAEVPNATIQAVSGSTTVPGTSTGRAPKMEVINGIIVPPAPDPVVNNATVAGVDINKNGVRDDVERGLAQNFGTNKNEYKYGFQAALNLQSVLTADASKRGAVLCSIFNSTKNNKPKPSTEDEEINESIIAAKAYLLVINDHPRAKESYQNNLAHTLIINGSGDCSVR